MNYLKIPDEKKEENHQKGTSKNGIKKEVYYSAKEKERVQAVLRWQMRTYKYLFH